MDHVKKPVYWLVTFVFVIATCMALIDMSKDNVSITGALIKLKNATELKKNITETKKIYCANSTTDACTCNNGEKKAIGENGYRCVKKEGCDVCQGTCKKFGLCCMDYEKLCR